MCIEILNGSVATAKGCGKKLVQHIIVGGWMLNSFKSLMAAAFLNAI